MQGFLLGLANGVTCLAYCAPVLLPFMLGEGYATRRNWIVLGKFLGGRLGGYLLFGVLAWLAYRFLAETGSYRQVIFGGVYAALAGLMLFYGLAKVPAACAGAGAGAALRRLLHQWPAMLPWGLGFVTGLNLCPPFLMAFAGAAGAGSLVASLVFFMVFFVGTAVYFIPLPFLGLLNKHEALRIVGKLAAVLMAIYYLATGVILILGGINAL